MRAFAQLLIVHEARTTPSSPASPRTDFPVCEKLRSPLASLMGSTGFRALLARALTLANTEVTWLRAVQVKADGSLTALQELPARPGRKEYHEGKVALLAQLLGLLVAFVGEKLTVRIMREIWPKLPLSDLNLDKKPKNEKAKHRG